MKKDAEKKIKEDEKKIEEDEKKRKKEEIKKCPGCGQRFQKDGGCYRMTCSIPKCGVTFCWDCLRILSFSETCYCQQEIELQSEEVLNKFADKKAEFYNFFHFKTKDF